MKKGLLHLAVTVAAIGVFIFLWNQLGCGRGGDALCDQCERPARLPDPATTGTIRGKVLFQGRLPRPPADPRNTSDCAAHRKGEDDLSLARDNPLQVRDGRLRNTVVFVKSGPIENFVYEIPSQPLVIDNRDCFYAPRVATAQAHQLVLLNNADSISHNVRSLGQGRAAFNVTLANRGANLRWRFHEPQPILRLKCDIHPWMVGWLGIFDHPFHAVTGEDGTFEFKSLPPGRYEIAAWHEGEGLRRQELVQTATIEVSGTLELPDFVFEAR
ncbi:MAG: hypothetical protein HY716_15450 [Planctomycetes bacterium]|nr:hypothetical protein [Planctomycetota bacterium]